MATRILINGGAGRMGLRILSLLLDDPELTLAGLRETPDHAAQGKDAGCLLGGQDLGVPVVDRMDKLPVRPDVVIDFTAPPATLSMIDDMGENKIPLVTGTTGFTEEEKARIAALLEPVPFVLAPNMSVGVNVLFKLVEETAKILGAAYDAEIVEAHHRFKADAPSGTALRLAEGIARAKGIDLSAQARYGREGKPGPRTQDEVGILAVRAGDIVGEHTVTFAGIGERLELVHKAHTRDNFALGSLRAAKWVVAQPPGVYDMMDVLGLR
jgi:4-hydroxy-tetrahydrodipicolinate reductase